MKFDVLVATILKKNILNEVNCWKGYHKEGTKKLSGKTVNNCVKNKKKKKK